VRDHGATFRLDGRFSLPTIPNKFFPQRFAFSCVNRPKKRESFPPGGAELPKKGVKTLLPAVLEESTMPFDLLRVRVQRAIARLDRLPDRECDDLAEAVQECLRLAEEIWTLRRSEE
jgi:hypothetical protein